MIALPGKKKIKKRSGEAADKAEFREDSAVMSLKEQLIQGLFDAGCSPETAEKIGTLYEAGCYGEVLHRMKVQRCLLIDEMHESQRKVDRIDFLIRHQEKQMK